MNALHEAIGDIADEAAPTSPPVDRAMLRGRRIRKRRLTAAMAGGAAVLAVVAGGAASIPALTGSDSPAAPAGGQRPGGIAAMPANTPLVRPVLLTSAPGSTTRYGDVSQVNPATLRLFGQLTCKPGMNPLGTGSSWQASVGYTGTRWDTPGSQVVSCDSIGNKYVLGQAVVVAGQVTSAVAGQSPPVRGWLVTLTLNGAAKAAVGQLTTSQYRTYSGRLADPDAAALDSLAIVVNGNVASASMTASPITSGTLQLAGADPNNGLSEAQAKALAARI